MKISLFAILLSTLIIAGCSSSKAQDSDTLTNATPQPVTQQTIEWRDYSKSNPAIALKYPSNTTMREQTSDNALLSIDFEFNDQTGTESLNLSILRTKPTKAELEDLDTDLYNGKETRFGNLAVNCYLRSQKYIKDQYTFLNRRYTGTAPDTGYRYDCTAPFGPNTVYLQYSNDVDSLALFRKRQNMIKEMLSSVR